ncbi:hypothetical protein Tco_1132451 [Tanacetum coccineum]|uniref:Uncharacterized protein n=1 Tax=Tanacetum coccineum TaxID=301880 RepID=A0ABQ5JDN7_9ASTR
MEYLPKKIWRQSDRERAKAKIQAIEKMLKSRRIMRSLERFVGGRPFETSAGNPVKEILLKLNLPDHRSILTDSKVTPTKHGRMTKPYSSPRFIANCFNVGELEYDPEIEKTAERLRKEARRRNFQRGLSPSWLESSEPNFVLGLNLLESKHHFMTNMVLQVAHETSFKQDTTNHDTAPLKPKRSIQATTMTRLGKLKLAGEIAIVVKTVNVKQPKGRMLRAVTLAKVAKCLEKNSTF